MIMIITIIKLLKYNQLFKTKSNVNTHTENFKFIYQYIVECNLNLKNKETKQNIQ